MESEVEKHDGEVWFENGWCKFASCHGLTLGHLLVFRYEGNSHFYVLIFDAIATKIDYPLDDQLQVCRLEDSESDDNSIEIIDGFMPSQKTREIDGGVGMSTSRRTLKGKAVVNDEEYKALENLQELMTTNGEAEILTSSSVVSASWFAFARENKLQLGDVCVFEVIMRDDVVLKVHIFKCN
ncbi:hypothetical protein ACB092_05G259800 [Castanea dentata]